MNVKLHKALEKLLEQVGETPSQAQTVIPSTWKEFNELIGLPIHPATNLPTPMTPYQIAQGEYKGHRTITNKTNKGGITENYNRINIKRGTIGDCAGYQILYGSSKEKLANENINRTGQVFKDSPSLEPYLAEEPTDSYIRLTNGTEFIALPRKVSSFRSWPRVKSIFLDEAAHYELIDDKSFFAAALGRLANTNGYMDIVSTPHGQRGYFYQTFIDAEAGKNRFKPWRIHYTEAVAAGLISQEFIDEAKLSMSPQMFAQEFECAFIPSSEFSAIEAGVMEKMFTSGDEVESW